MYGQVHEVKRSPFVGLMFALAAPAVASIMGRLSARLMKRMEKNAALAEEAYEATSRHAQQRGLVLGPLSDANEDLNNNLERQLVLVFPVMNEQGSIISRRGVCRVTLKSDGVARRVHAFYEKDDGSVVDIFVDGTGDVVEPGGGEKFRGGTQQKNVILDAEIVSPDRSSRKKRKD